MGVQTVIILAAGFGRRMGHFSRMINKALVPYKNKPVISHIFDKFPSDTKFIIACGHHGQQLKDYVSLVHSEKNIFCVDVPDYNESYTGPATSLVECAKYVTGGFFWITCDTLFDFDYTGKLGENWIGVSPVDSGLSQDYCWVERNGNDIVVVRNKEHSDTAVDAFIGLMYVHDSRYIECLARQKSTEACHGFGNIGLQAHTVYDWMDFGTYDKWYDISYNTNTLSLPKPNELLYVDNGKVVKFTTDLTLAQKRFNRAQLNPQCLPANIKYAGNFLVYDRVEGTTVYSHLTPTLFVDLLNWVKSSIWRGPVLEFVELLAHDFYYTKTIDRLRQFRKQHSTWSEFPVVNQHTVKTIDEYLASVDFDLLSNETRWQFTHGDLQLDNIIYNQECNTFTAIDWRPEFSGDTCGDVYYDLAKLLCGMYLSYSRIKNGEMVYIEYDGDVYINDLSVDNVSEYESQIKMACINMGMRWDKIKLLVPIIYLNMAPLHNYPMAKYLIALSQLHFEALE